MIDLIKKAFGIGSAPNFGELVKQGALILDVRTKGEYKGGNIKGSLNIPLDELKNNLQRIPDKNQVIVTCCASGARSSSACGILKSHGYTNVINGGGWPSLQHKL